MTLSFTQVEEKRVKKAQKVEGGSSFEVHSAGFTSGNYAKLFLNDKLVSTCSNETGCRGLNLVAMDAVSHKVLHSAAYDTYGNNDQSKLLMTDVKKLPDGTIFMVAVKDEASNKLSEKVKEFFTKLGSVEINALGFREAWAFIGVKGQ